MLPNKFENNVGDLVVVVSGPSSTVVMQPGKIFAHVTIAQHAKLSVAGAWLIFGGGENNICHVVYA